MNNNLNLNFKKTLFYEMLRIRRVEEAIRLRYKEQKMRCPIHLSIGQEAIAVGICSQLKSSDALFSNHRSHAHYLAKGGNLNKMIAELYGKKEGCTKGRGGSMHLIDLDVGFQGSSPISGGSIPIATGFAFALQMQNRSALSSVFFGEAATEEGLFCESLNFAALKNLPILFICENNLYAVHSHLEERQAKHRSRTQLAKAHGIYSLSGDGNDIEDVYKIAQNGIEHIRKGKGPVFIEFQTYLLCEHVSTRTRDTNDPKDGETAAWQKRCPLKRCQEALLHANASEKKHFKHMEEKINFEIKESFSFAEKSPFPCFDLDDEKAFAE